MANIKDIAKIAGVSVATVSRSLRNPEVVRDNTLKRVQAAVRSLNYQPNGLAAGLRRQRSDKVLVAVPDIDNPFYSTIVQAIESVANDNGIKVLLGETQNRQDRLDAYAEMLMRKEADGIILLGATVPSSLGERGSVPIVLACEPHAMLSCPKVRIDNEDAACLATRHLIDLGHTEIAFLNGAVENVLSMDRRRGYEGALRAAGLPVRANFILDGDYSVRSGYEAMNTLFTRKRRPTAVFCANDEMAIGVLRAISEKGLSVPGDISVVGFDDIKFAEFTNPPLTTIYQPRAEIGRVAMRMMLKEINGTGGEYREVILPHHLTVRASTGPALP